MTRSHDPVDKTVGAVVRRPAILRSLERFVHVEAASGIVLLAAAMLALVWANSPAGELYERLWHMPVGLRLGGWSISLSLHFVVNDLAMTVFFLVVGLEIRREMHEGALADLRLAALPIFAAAGGVVAPALIYASLNATPELRNGWAVPTATDIAFAVGVLALLGRRVPGSLRVLLLALAIIDDIIAVLIIALFYADGLQPLGFAIAAGGVAGVFAFHALGVRSAWAYVLPGVLVWFGMFRAGIHPAIAGVVLGLLAPMRRTTTDVTTSPAERVQKVLHPWVAYGVMPVFALANSGVHLEDMSLATVFQDTVSLGVILGLCIGKPLGITLASYAAIRLRLAAMPAGANLGGVLLVGCLGGIGFTMAIFIANLAFATPALLAAAKLAILVASALSGVLGVCVGLYVLRAPTALRSSVSS